MALLRRDQTRHNIKVAAQKLFAQRGIDGVTIQEIVSAAGQRNNASLHYHFGTKDDLVKELVVDGAKIVDQRRQEMLDQLESEGGPRSVREVIYALALPVLSRPGEDVLDGTYVRFIASLQLAHRDLLRKALEDKWNTGYKRCLEHLRRLLPDIPAAVLDQRLSLIGIYGNAALAAREAALETDPENHHFWGQPFTIENYVDSMQATLEAPPSPATLAKLPPALK